MHLQFVHLRPHTCFRLKVYRTGYHANDAYTAYLEMGSPKDLSPSQIGQLDELTRDAAETDKIIKLLEALQLLAGR